MAMIGGKGKYRYDVNSQGQAEFMEAIFSTVLLKYLDEMRIPPGCTSVRVADFGCAAGSNTIRNVETILRRLKRRFPDGEGPELQAFFQDVHEIDFNALFALFKTISANAEGRAAMDLKYFAAGVPGSCYQRQLPENSIHFALCSFVLCWLSQIPPSVRDPSDPAYSGGHFQLDAASEATIEAYRSQANSDLANFLEARAVELVPGGGMTLIFGVRKVVYPFYYFPTATISEQVVNDMIEEGILDSKLRDSFNTYNHFPVVDDVEAILKRYESVFRVDYQAILPFFKFSADLSLEEKAGKFYSLHRGTHASSLEAHLGKEMMEKYYARFEAAFLKAMNDGSIDIDPNKHTGQMVIVATRREKQRS